MLAFYGALVLSVVLSDPGWLNPVAVAASAFVTFLIAVLVAQRKQPQQSQVDLSHGEDRFQEPAAQLESIAHCSSNHAECRYVTEALSASEHYLRTLFNSTLHTIVIADEEGRYVEVNPSACELFGLSQAELLGKRISDFADPPYNSERLWRHFQQQGYSTGELRLVRPDGQIREVEFSSVANFLPNRHLAVLYDITARKQAEEELLRQSVRSQLFADITLKIRQSLCLEEILQTTVTEVRKLLRTDRVLIYRIAPTGEGRVVTEATIPGCNSLLNQTFSAEVFPQEYHELYCQGHMRVIADLDQADLSACHLQFLQQLQVKAKLVVPIVLREKLWGLMIAHQCDEQRQWSSFETDLLKQLANQVSIAISQAQLLEALRQSEEKFRNLVEQTNDWVWEIDKRNIFSYVNPKVTEVLGYSPEEVIGKSTFDFMEAPEVERFMTVLEPILTRQEPFTHLEKRLLHKEKYTVILETSGAPVFDQQNRFQGYRGIARDVTQRKLAEQEIRKALLKEKELNELRSQFISMASHELRTPLTAILTATELIEYYSHQWTETENREQIHIIQTAVEDMRQLMEDVLLIGRAEAGKLKANPIKLNPSQFCKQLIRQMELGTGEQHNITFIDRCSYTTIYSDEKLLRQILINLLSNAIKYSPKQGIIQLQLSCENKQIVFQIRDEGIGIPPEDQPHLFNSFYRAKNVGTVAGTGLGLAIVKRCVDALQGQIEFKSRIGAGTIFKVTLPIVSNALPEAASEG